VAKVITTPVAASIPTDSDFTVQEELDKVKAAASPAFSLGRSGNCPNGTWLLRVGGPPSNKTGIPIRTNSPVITGISVGNEDVTSFDIEVYEHEGAEVNLTLLTTVSIVSSRTATFTVNIAATQGRQLAAKVVNGSAKNPGVDFELKGST
jgi:hypothetical protein